MKSVKLGDRIIFPGKVVCIGRNYVGHVRELGNELPTEPVIFLKPNSSISDSICSYKDEPIHYEGELSFLIMDGELFAVGFGLDLTKRETQSRLKAKGLPWERAKAFDGSAVFSGFIPIEGSISDLRLELYINGIRMQQGGCELMMIKPEELLAEAAGFLTFEDGDLLMTGTPEGVGQINQGDQFEAMVFDKEKLLIRSRWHAR